MTWTYTPSALSGSTLFQVRLLIGDTLTTDQQLQDEEINQIIAGRNTIYGAAADACRSLAAKFSRSVTQKAGGSGANFSDLAKAYSLMATRYEQKAAAAGSGLPYAGGISVTDKENQERDTDRVAPQFNIGMEDNFSTPIGPVGNETEDSSASPAGQ